jgi:hypothetical protein
MKKILKLQLIFRILLFELGIFEVKNALSLTVEFVSKHFFTATEHSNVASVPHYAV